VIVVTGASRGLGLAICERLIANKIPVFGIARNVENLNFPSLAADISSFEQLSSVVKHIKKMKTPVQGLINAAGIASMNLALTTPSSTVSRIINTNLIGAIYSCQLFTPLLIRNGSGVIINFSTIAVSLGLKGESVYVASKAGVEAFTKSFAREVADFNISVNCIAPGPIETDLIKGVPKNKIEDVISHQVIKKNFKEKDVCDLVELLLDKRSFSLSGEVFHIGGV
jgi:3-oxoacyl-[acyl-carrier protein] reductase